MSAGLNHCHIILSAGTLCSLWGVLCGPWSGAHVLTGQQKDSMPPSTATKAWTTNTKSTTCTQVLSYCSCGTSETFSVKAGDQDKALTVWLYKEICMVCWALNKIGSSDTFICPLQALNCSSSSICSSDRWRMHLEYKVVSCRSVGAALHQQKGEMWH